MDLFDTPKPVRTGSYPFKDIAEDFGLRYGDVLISSDAPDYATIRNLSPGRYAVLKAAVARIIGALGDDNQVVELSNAIEGANANMKRLQRGE